MEDLQLAIVFISVGKSNSEALKNKEPDLTARFF